MADGLLFVYSDPGPVPPAEFDDWYDNEHGPARLTVPGISAGYRFRAVDDLAPRWLAYYELTAGALESASYRALATSASAREKSIMSRLATLDRRVYELISDSGAPSFAAAAPSAAAAPAAAVLAPPAVVLAVSLSVPPGREDDLAAWYTDEHIPMLLAVPGWRRIRRYRLTSGTGPAYLSLHEVVGVSVFDEDSYKAAVTTPWRNRIVESAIGRERRVFGFHGSFGA
jgi:hypothetical protein